LQGNFGAVVEDKSRSASWYKFDLHTFVVALSNASLDEFTYNREFPFLLLFNERRERERERERDKRV
jgi:hypothetical protein